MSARWELPRPAPRQRSHGIRREMGMMMRAVQPPRKAAVLWAGVVSREAASGMMGEWLPSDPPASTEWPLADRVSGHYGQNAYILFRFTNVSQDADGPAAEPAREAAPPV